MRAFWRRLLPLALMAAAACGGDDTLQPPPEEAVTPGCRDATLPSTARYRVCFPQTWNGELVVYAHGYVAPNEPVALPADGIGGVGISLVVNALGYAFATTSYRANGLVADLAVEDLAQLDQTIRDRYRPDPTRTFLVGPSEGGLVAALAVEQNPDLYAGALAACGPIGDFALQVDWFGDFRTVFDYFFPGLLPGSAVESPAELQDNWESTYVPAVLAALADDPGATAQLLAVTGAPVDALDPETAGATVIGLLWYNVFSTADAQARLGGQPYDNTTRVYQGSLNDEALNAGVARFTADPAARAAVARFQTTGDLTRPVVTLHITGDPIVPIVHEELYAEKVAAAGDTPLLDQTSVSRYGHCTFQQAELLTAFNTLVDRATP